jgi:hypothetical protein
MANKKIWLGMLVVVALAFGMTVLGCETPEWYYKIQNDSSFRISNVVFSGNGSTVKTDSDGIASGSSKVYFFADSDQQPNRVTLTVTVNNTAEEVSFGDFGTMTAGEENAKVLILTGTTKESLQISRKN